MSALSTESARAYVRAMMAAHGGVIISSATMQDCDGCTYCDVNGAYVVNGQLYPIEWTVWLESGRLYGEW